MDYLGDICLAPVRRQKPATVEIPRMPELRRKPGRKGHIGRAASDLGVSSSHLWRVVKGERVGPELRERYNAWRQKEGIEQ